MLSEIADVNNKVEDDEAIPTSAWPAIGQGCGCFLVLVGMAVVMYFPLVILTISKFAK